MFLISHRGNVRGKCPSKENSPDYILEAVKLGFDVELDVRFKSNELYLGHDYPQYKIDISFLEDIRDKAWIHCKDMNSFYFFMQEFKNFNFFYHTHEDVVLTSKLFSWVYPGRKIGFNSIVVLPETFSCDSEYLRRCTGICSDYISNYK